MWHLIRHHFYCRRSNQLLPRVRVQAPHGQQRGLPPRAGGEGQEQEGGVWTQLLLGMLLVLQGQFLFLWSLLLSFQDVWSTDLYQVVASCIFVDSVSLPSDKSWFCFSFSSLLCPYCCMKYEIWMANKWVGHPIIDILERMVLFYFMLLSLKYFY